MAETAGLIQVGPFAGDTFETVHYRSCDLCEHTAVEDIWAGLSEDDWRPFYVDPGAAGLCVCGSCVDGYLREAPCSA